MLVRAKHGPRLIQSIKRRLGLRLVEISRMESESAIRKHIHVPKYPQMRACVIALAFITQMMGCKRPPFTWKAQTHPNHYRATSR